MPQYRTAAEVLTSIQQIQWATQGVQGNRSKINKLMNGDPPWTEPERRANRLNTNTNWLEGPRIVKNAAYQLQNAFFGPGDFFTITLDTYSKVPIWKRDEWSLCLTQYVNSALHRCRRLRSVLEEGVSQVVLHGPGPSLWRKSRSVVPHSAGVDDVLVPAGTLADMSNLDFFAVYQEWTWGQLYDMAHGDAVDKGWNTEYVDGLLANLYKQPLQPLYQGNRWLFPEKITEDFKENTNTFAAAALGKVLAWDTYHLDEKTNKWNRRILLDYNNVTPEGLRHAFDPERVRPEFLFEKDGYADDWRHLIHWFIGNCSTVAPFRYYSIRSIGYQLYGPCFAQNMVRNRMTDHVLQTLLMLFRNVSEDNRERLQDFELHHLGILPDGVAIVNGQERYAADWNLVGNFLNTNRQLMAESSAAFLPDIATEGEKPAMTATESLIRNNASVTLTSSVQNQLYPQAGDLFYEMMRRVCLKDKRDPITEEVMEEMKDADIPPEILDIEAMEVQPNRVMGGGNRAVELTTARALFEAKGAFGPTADLPIRRKYMLALTNDADFVRQTLPDEPIVTDSTIAAEAAFATLMTKVPYVNATTRTLNEVEYIETLVQMTALAMRPLQALQEQPAALPIIADRVSSLMNVVQHIEQHIATLGQDVTAREAARNYQRTVIQMANQLRAYGERAAEMEQAMQGQQGVDPATQGKIVALNTLAQAKAQIMQQTAGQKLQHKDAAFLSEQQRKDAQTVAEIRRKDVLTHADVASKDLTTSADLVHQARQAHLDRAVSVADAAQEAVHTEHAHQLDQAHMDEAHQQELTQAQEKHETDLAAARAKAAAAAKAKPKPTSKK